MAPLCNGGNTNAVDGYISTYWFMLHSGVVCILYTRVPYQFESNHRQEVLPPLMDSLDDRKFPTLLESQSTETEKVSSIPHPDWTDEHSWTPKMLPWSHLSFWAAGGEGTGTPSPWAWGTSLCSLSTAPVACTKNMNSQKWSTDHVLISWRDCHLCFFFNCRSSLWEVNRGSKMSCNGQH